MNLFAVCTENGQRLKNGYEHGFLEEEKPRAEPFLDTIRRKGRLSINAKPTSLLLVLQGGAYYNAYRIAQRKSEAEGTDREALLREIFGDSYAQRTAFDCHFAEGDSFLYSALNIGNAGATSYGEYCVVWRDDLRPEYQVAYLYGDSLKHFVHSDPPIIDEAELRSSGACHATKEYLALSKHRKVALTGTEKQWAECLCSDNPKEYIEAIFTNGTGSVATSYIEENRIKEANLDLYDDTTRQYYRRSPDMQAEFIQEIKDRLPDWLVYDDICKELETMKQQGREIELRGIEDA